jgi:hypothetical protein
MSSRPSGWELNVLQRWLDAELAAKGRQKDILFCVATPAGSSSPRAFQTFKRKCACQVLKNIVNFLAANPGANERALDANLLEDLKPYIHDDGSAAAGLNKLLTAVRPPSRCAPREAGPSLTDARALCPQKTDGFITVQEADQLEAARAASMREQRADAVKQRVVAKAARRADGDGYHTPQLLRLEPFPQVPPPLSTAAPAPAVAKPPPFPPPPHSTAAPAPPTPKSPLVQVSAPKSPPPQPAREYTQQLPHGVKRERERIAPEMQRTENSSAAHIWIYRVSGVMRVPREF